MALGTLGFLLAVDESLERVIAITANIFENWHDSFLEKN
jgi:hypothetical protein